MRTLLRQFGAILLAVGALCASAQAQSFPSRTIEIVVSYGAGGSTDLVARAIAQKLQAALKDALGDAVVKEKLLGLGITPQFVPGDEQRDINARDISAWKQVAKDAGIEVK